MTSPPAPLCKFANSVEGLFPKRDGVGDGSQVLGLKKRPRTQRLSPTGGGVTPLIHHLGEGGVGNLLEEGIDLGKHHTRHTPDLLQQAEKTQRNYFM